MSVDRGCSTGDCAGVPTRMVRIGEEGVHPYCDECSSLLIRMGDDDCGPFDPVTPEMVERGARALCEYGVVTVDGEVATWERHSRKLTQMARIALNAAIGPRTTPQEDDGA